MYHQEKRGLNCNRYLYKKVRNNFGLSFMNDEANCCHKFMGDYEHA